MDQSNPSIHQSINQSINQLINQSTYVSVNQVTCGHYLLRYDLSGLHQVQCTSERHLFRIMGSERVW